MNKLTSSMFNLYKDKDTPLNILFYVFLMIPIAYGLYIASMVMSTNTSLSLLFASTSEGLNLIVYLSSLYSAYVVKQVYKRVDTRQAVVALCMVFIAQLFYMNYVTIALLGFYFYQNKECFEMCKHPRRNEKHEKQGKQACIVSILVLLCAIITTFAKFQLNILF